MKRAFMSVSLLVISISMIMVMLCGTAVMQ